MFLAIENLLDARIYNPKIQDSKHKYFQNEILQNEKCILRYCLLTDITVPKYYNNIKTLCNHRSANVNMKYGLNQPNLTIREQPFPYGTSISIQLRGKGINPKVKDTR